VARLVARAPSAIGRMRKVGLEGDSAQPKVGEVEALSGDTSL